MEASIPFLHEKPKTADELRRFRRSLVEAQGTIRATYDVTALDDEAQLLGWNELITLCTDLSAVYDEPSLEAIVL